MTQQFNTAAGPVVLEPTGSDQWGVFASNQGGRFIGTIKKVGSEFIATPEGGRPIACKDLGEAAQIVAA